MREELFSIEECLWGVARVGMRVRLVGEGEIISWEGGVDCFVALVPVGDSRFGDGVEICCMREYLGSETGKGFQLFLICTFMKTALHAAEDRRRSFFVAFTICPVKEGYA